MSKQLVADYPILRPNLLTQNPHIQTVAAHFMRDPVSSKVPQQHVVPLADGDRLIIHDDEAKSWITGDRISILVPGLCGSHNSSYVRRIAIRLRQHGIRTVRVDLRGFGASEFISRGHMHAGCSNDVRDIVDFLHQRHPLSKISLVGFSLGANIVLKTAADWGERHPEHVDSAIAVSPPLDLARCSSHLRSFGNRLYEYYFMSRLIRSIARRRKNVLGLIDNGLNPLPDRMVHFDDQFTACLLYTSPSPRDRQKSRMPSSA